MNEATTDKLVFMKLMGMEEAFRQQLEQPNAARLSFEERFAMLVDREWDRRSSRKLARRIKAARVKQNACIEDIDWQQPRGLDRSVITSLSECGWIQHHHNLIITGPTGTGKTFLACAFVNAACRKGYRARYHRASRFFKDLAITRGDGSWPKYMRKMQKLDLLVIDDWGLETLQPEDRRDMLEILDERYTTRSMIFSTQYPVAKWHELIGEPTLADSILDRVVHNSHRIELKAEGESMRKRYSPLTSQHIKEVIT